MDSIYNSFPYLDTFAFVFTTLCYLICFEGAGLITDAYLKKLPADFSLLGFVKSRFGLIVGLSVGVAIVQLLPLLNPAFFSEFSLISFTPFPYRDIILMSLVSALIGVFLKLFGPVIFPMNPSREDK